MPNSKFKKLKVLLLCSPPLFDVLSHWLEVRQVTVVDSFDQSPHAVLSDTKTALNVLHSLGNAEFFYVSNTVPLPSQSWMVLASNPRDHIDQLDLSQLGPELDRVLSSLRPAAP